MTASALYELHNIKRVVQKDRMILDIGHLAIPEGAITGIVGPNGAGKSTLLKIMAFLVRPEEGEMLFRGKGVAQTDIYNLRRMVTMVDQSPLLFRGTVFKNVAYGLRVRNVPTGEWEPMVKEALSLVDIAGYENRSVKGLSGGEIQRVAIARALVFRPQVVLLDEPTAGVDAARVEMVEALIREVNERSGTGVIFSTHQLAQAYRLTEDVIHLIAGKISEESIENVFIGHVEVEDGQRRICVKNGVKVTVVSICEGLRRFSIPASGIIISRNSEIQENKNRCEGTVTKMEIRGDKIRLRIDGDLSLRVEVEPNQLHEKGISLGARVMAVFPPEAVRILD